jgi:hypothetical protein
MNKPFYFSRLGFSLMLVMVMTLTFVAVYPLVYLQTSDGFKRLQYVGTSTQIYWAAQGEAQRAMTEAAERTYSDPPLMAGFSRIATYTLSPGDYRQATFTIQVKTTVTPPPPLPARGDEWSAVQQLLLLQDESVSEFADVPAAPLTFVTPLASFEILGTNQIIATFSREMGPSILNPLNFTISGPGQGTLTPNPDSITLIGDPADPLASHTYLLSWTSGVVVSGQPITIKITNVTDSQGNAVQAIVGFTQGGTGVLASVSITNTSGIDINNNTWLDPLIPFGKAWNRVKIVLTDTSGNIVYQGEGPIRKTWTYDQITSTIDPSSQFRSSNHQYLIALDNGDKLMIAGRNSQNAGYGGSFGNGYGIVVYPSNPNYYSNPKMIVASYYHFVSWTNPRAFRGWSQSSEISFKNGSSFSTAVESPPFLGTFEISILPEPPRPTTSVLIDDSQKTQINTWIGNPGLTWQLLYQRTYDGSSSANFHERCDGQGPTVTIVKLDNGKLIGGYASVSWNSGGSYFGDSSCFLFSLTNSFKHSHYRYTNNLYGNSSYGPTFGGGHDLYISSNMATGYTNIGFSYITRVGAYGSTEAKNDFAGSFYSWTITELEVWKVY